MKISVIGAGSWGRTFADLLAKRGHEVLLWSRTPGEVKAPLVATDNLHTACKAECIVLAIPVQQLADVLSKVKEWNANAVVVSLAKGIEQKRQLRVSQICKAELRNFRFDQFAVLSGPTLAEEIAQGQPATAVVAGVLSSLAVRVQAEFSSPLLRLYSSSDLIGVELAGALKNVIALSAGICSGLNFGQNVQGALLTRGLVEISRLGVALGGKAETFAGLAGLGDLVTTCSSALSRNRTVGVRIARGEGLPTILSTMNEVAEGVWTASAALALAKSHGLEMPITSAVCQVLYENKSPQDAIRDLMTRSLKSE